jgi:hypothetical protein
MGTTPTISIKRIDVDCHWAVICAERGILKRFVSEAQALQFKRVAEYVAKSVARLREKGNANGDKDGSGPNGCEGEDRE